MKEPVAIRGGGCWSKKTALKQKKSNLYRSWWPARTRIHRQITAQYNPNGKLYRKWNPINDAVPGLNYNPTTEILLNITKLVFTALQRLQYHNQRKKIRLNMVKKLIKILQRAPKITVTSPGLLQNTTLCGATKEITMPDGTATNLES